MVGLEHCFQEKPKKRFENAAETNKWLLLQKIGAGNGWCFGQLLPFDMCKNILSYELKSLWLYITFAKRAKELNLPRLQSNAQCFNIAVWGSNGSYVLLVLGLVVVFA